MKKRTPVRKMTGTKKQTLGVFLYAEGSLFFISCEYARHCGVMRASPHTVLRNRTP